MLLSDILFKFIKNFFGPFFKLDLDNLNSLGNEIYCKHLLAMQESQGIRMYTRGSYPTFKKVDLR